MADFGRCRSCNALVLWAYTAAGGVPMPLEPDPDPVGNVLVCDEEQAAHYATEPGRAIVFGKRAAESRREQGVPLHVVHFIACPAARQHRRRR